ncbi:hypothetical protein R1sor_021349 [Riccia sorocarpa]|uniref:Angio-associated migratory cell protein n=1 Tax=Riccia sorocarpa TaxID=122646 RepID=A0ABD3GGV5_9MARC
MEGDDGARVFLDEGDIVEEVVLDEDGMHGGDSDEDVEGVVEEMGDMMLEMDDEEDEDKTDDSDHTFTGHTDSIYCVAISPGDLGLVASGGGDEVGYLWRVGVAEDPQPLRGHKDSVVQLAFNNDGSLLASAGLDGVIIIWQNGVSKHHLDGPGEGIEFIKWHPRGNLLLAGSEDFSAWLWNADSGRCLNVFTGHSGSVTCGDFTPDGKLLCTGSGDSSFRVWNPRTAATIHVVQGHPYHTEGVVSVAIHADSSIAITGSTDATACIVNLQTGKVSGTLSGEHTKSVECVGLSSVLPLAATGSLDGKLVVWDLQSLTRRHTCEHEEGVVKLIWPTGSHLIYTASLDGSVRIWDSRSGLLVKRFHGHADSITDMAVSKDGRLIITGSDDMTAKIFVNEEPPSSR